MKAVTMAYLFLAALSLVLVFCNGEQAESLNIVPSGTIFISVVDNDSAETPIPDVEITLTPENIKKITDANGTCSFSASPGDHYVNADVCCAGPRSIHYHELVTVVKNDTTEVKLTGCLGCF